MEEAENMFKSFQRELKQSSLKVLKQAGHGDLKESRKKNEDILSSLNSLEEKIRTLEASIEYIQNFPTPVRINLKAKERMRLRSSDEFEFLNLSQNDDNISREILDEIAQTVAEDEEYLHLLAKRNRLISTQKKLQSQDFNDLLMSILYDENNNLPMKSFELKDKKDFRLTRTRKRTFGGSLINPIKYYSCLICGDKHLDYSIRDLKNHYRISHGYEVGPGLLPVTKSQLEETIARDRQRSTICHLCNTSFESEDDLLLHKSLHINPKFCRHKCPFENCQEGFVLKEHLENHQMVHET